MTLLDIILLFLLALAVWRGFQHGMVQEFFRLLGLAVGLVLAFLLMQPGGKLLVQSLGLSPRLAPGLAFVGLLLVGMLTVHLMGLSLQWLLDTLRLGVISRLMGGAVAALKMTLMLGLIFHALALFDLPPASWRSSSLGYVWVMEVGEEAWKMAREVWPEVQEVGLQLNRMLSLEVNTPS